MMATRWEIIRTTAGFMADEEEGNPLLPLQLHEQFQHLAAQRDIERRKRLVENDKPGPAGQRPRQGDPLALTARDLMDAAGR